MNPFFSLFSFCVCCNLSKETHLDEVSPSLSLSLKKEVGLEKGVEGGFGWMGDN